MKSLFDLDGKLYAFFSKTADLLLIGLAWLICCIPVVTMLPATSALFYTAYQCVFLERGKVFATYRAAFVCNFKRNALLGLAFAAIFGLLALLWRQLLLHAPSFFAAFGAVCLLILSVLTLLLIVWLVPVCALFSERASVVLRLNFVLSLRKIGKSIRILLMLAAGAAAVYILPPLILLIPSLIAWRSIPQLVPALERYLPQPPALRFDS